MPKSNIYHLSTDGAILEFDGKDFVETNAKRIKKGFCGAVVPSVDIRSHTFKIQPERDKERLDTLVEIAMFEGGGLDLEREYSIAYVKHKLDFESSWLIEAFAVERERLTDLFGAEAKRCGRLDLIAVPYLVYEGLYPYERVEKDGVDLFLYISDDSSYAVLCKEGRYIAHRDLPPLSSIATKARTSVEVVKDSLRKRGLESEAYAPDELLLLETLEETFSKIVEKVAQTVNHKRGIFSIKRVDRLYLDFESSVIPGLWELFESYGFEGCSKGALVCCEELDPSLRHDGLETLYLSAAKEKRVEAPNLTIFEKRQNFLKSHTGRFVAVIVAALLLTASYGFYRESILSGLERENIALSANIETLKRKAAELRKTLAKERGDLRSASMKLKSAEESILAIEETLDAALLIEKSKEKRREMFEDVDRAMAKERLMAATFEQNGSKMAQVEILSSYSGREKIARFMKYLLKMGYGSVGTEAIKLDEDLYSSKVEIIR